MSKPQTEARANMIAATLDGKPQMLGLGFTSIITIIMDLLPTIIACFNPDSGSQAVEYVAKRFKLSDAANEYRGYFRELFHADLILYRKSMITNEPHLTNRMGLMHVFDMYENVFRP